MTTRTQFLAGLVAAGLVAGLGAQSKADDKKVNVTGTWSWTMTRNGNEVTQTLKLKQDGEKVTGTLEGPQGEPAEIKEGTVKDGEVAFKMTRENNGNTMNFDYKGKVEADTIKFKVEIKREGADPRTREFEAKRKSEKA